MRPQTGIEYKAIIAHFLIYLYSKKCIGFLEKIPKILTNVLQ